MFASALAIFVTGSAAAYVLVSVAGVNVPRYYPTLREFSYEIVPEAISMSLYGRMLYAFGAGLAVVIVHLILRPILAHIKLVKLRHLTVLAYTTVWFAISWIIVEEWHKWGIQKRGLDTTLPVNDEFYLAIIGLITFFGGVLLTAAGVKRVANVSHSAKKRMAGAQTNGRSEQM